MTPFHAEPALISICTLLSVRHVDLCWGLGLSGLSPTLAPHMGQDTAPLRSQEGVWARECGDLGFASRPCAGKLPRGVVEALAVCPDPPPPSSLPSPWASSGEAVWSLHMGRWDPEGTESLGG